MKKHVLFFALVFAACKLFSQFNIPSCPSTNIYFHTSPIQIYNPNLPLSASNPSSTGIPGGGTGLYLGPNINGGTLTPTFYSIIGNTYQWWNGAVWVNTGHSVTNGAAVNLGGGGGNIYNLVGGTGQVYRYNGTGNDVLILTIPGFSGGGPYDISGDCNGNFTIIKCTTPQWMNVYNPAGNLVCTYTMTGMPSTFAGGGFAVVGSTVYVRNTAGFFAGVITGSTINFSLAINNNNIVHPGDFASCPNCFSLTANSFNTGPIGCSNPTCNVVASTTTSAASYTWSGPSIMSGGNTATAVVNQGGVYTCTVTAGLCPGGQTVTTTTVIQTPTLGVTVAPTAKNCFALGTATATLAGGTPPFVFNWTSSASTTSVATGLSQGVQTLTISDAAGCIKTVTFNIGFANTLTTTATGTNVLCFGQTNGSASVTVTGGSGTYVYSWSNGQATGNAVNLPAGSYTVTVMDGAFCTSTAAITITQPTPLTVTINSSTTSICAGSTINLNSFGAGGTGPYTYTWSPGPTNSSQNVAETIPGTYNYIINCTDNNGCPASSNVNLTFNPIPLISVSNQTICYGDVGTLFANGAETYKWMPANYSGSSYSVAGTTNLILTVVGTNTSSGCSSLPVTGTLIVNPLPVPAIAASNNKGCVPLCMTFTASNSGGTMQSCSWDFGDGAFASNVNNTDRCYTIAGEYTVKATVTDNNGCVSSVTYSLESYPIPVADFNYSPLKPIINDDVIFTDATHEAKIAKWDWYFMNLPKPHSNYQNPVYQYNDPGTYAIALVTTSDHGCLDTIVRTIIVGEDYGIYVPNVFSPNGDGLNDVFQPKRIWHH